MDVNLVLKRIISLRNDGCMFIEESNIVEAALRAAEATRIMQACIARGETLLQSMVDAANKADAAYAALRQGVKHAERSDRRRDTVPGEAQQQDFVILTNRIEVLTTAIVTFCKAHGWAVDSWKNQSSIKPLFDISREVSEAVAAKAGEPSLITAAIAPEVDRINKIQ